MLTVNLLPNQLLIFKRQYEVAMVLVVCSSVCVRLNCPFMLPVILTQLIDQGVAVPIH